MQELDKLMGNPEHKDIFQNQLQISDEEIESDVATDVARTYPSSDYKKKLKSKQLKNCKQSLYNVLKAYANYNNEDYFFWGSNSNGMAIEVLFRLSIALLKLLEQYLLCDGLSQFFDTIRNKTPTIDPLELVYQAKDVVLTDETTKFLRDKVTALSVQEDGLVLNTISPDTAAAKNNNISNGIKQQQQQYLKQQQRQQRQQHDNNNNDDEDSEDIENLLVISDDEDSIDSLEDNELYSEDFDRGGKCIIN
ncbi:RabGAP/TBC domain-containing protein [Heterostelium album PN500]|uniref:RabGAP/TBC domain-containing protein n=1 Tax=Heterostelium pallidum (strain ATCC 26659 / Pp 5 / PN500) TaxID=670386 RepID=D3BR36_HETP5|nr:RabGAP/TBC domain-containing protein [Heterostelium album PN500]EFA75868.1 RabGAP/TBC domain-containing protein [Heterostelium album PN500]|eukprot:XP_020428002.1 RabGAP/TBC domain-containing protein [Heterostelium album PN500]